MNVHAIVQYKTLFLLLILASLDVQASRMFCFMDAMKRRRHANVCLARSDFLVPKDCIDNCDDIV
jgi:hypothetical protein